MLTKKIIKGAKSLMRLSLMCGILIAPSILSASNGDHEKLDKKLRQRSVKSLPYSELALSKMSSIPNDIVEEDEQEIENWMQDIHDPFWKEVYATDEEYEIENWMSNPAEWMAAK